MTTDTGSATVGAMRAGATAPELTTTGLTTTGLTTPEARTYELLTVDVVGRYVLDRGHLGGATEGDLTVREVSDGNLNAVYVVRAGGRGVAVKQALPYVRVHGESWPLTPSRADAEARAYDLMVRLTPDLVPAFHGYDPDRYTLVLEDLSDHRVLRGALAAGELPAGVGAGVGQFSGRLTFATSRLALPPGEHAALGRQFANPALCALTEAMIFDEPYIEHEHNRFAAGTADRVRVLRADRAFRTGVADLKHAFTTHAEAVVHGDLHTGSVMVGPGRVLVFDPEFCFVGPAGFDLGLLVANLLLAAVRAEIIDGQRRMRDYAAEQVTQAWTSFTGEIRRLWATRRDQTTPDGRVLDRWLGKILADVAGFAGLEAVRRLIGYAHLPEIDALGLADRRAITDLVLTVGRDLVVARDAVTQPSDLVAVAGLG